jgi:predicted transcriptional regulator
MPFDGLETAAEIVAAFVSNNSVRASELPALFETVHGALTKLGNAPAQTEAAAPQEPAVPIRKSITPQYLICLEDGKQFKSLKRHLAGLGLTPDQYRKKWKLAADYPMVAPDYALARSALAKKAGFGRGAAGATRGRKPKSAA